jgi:hypothetical protein
VARPASDEPFDRLLTRTLRSHRAAADEVCPEPDLLAAFVDGSLDRSERSSMERHASSCSRCAQILAATEASAQIPVAPVRPSIWTAWRTWQWVVPVATAVTVVGVWVAVSRPGSQPAVAPAAEAPSSAIRTMPADNALRERPQQKLAVPANPAQVAEEREAKSIEQPNADAPSASLAIASPPGSETTRLKREALESTAKLAKEEKRVPEAPAVTARQEETASADRLNRERSFLSARADAAIVLVRTSNPQVLWRGRGQAIERSEDGGATWTLERSVSESIAGGSSPLPDVVWFFSRSGLVMRHTLAGWIESKVPAAGIVSLRATSGDRATIELVDGRVFETTDSGASWKAR